MPQAPNYPIITIWDILYNILADDSYFQTKLAKSVSGGLALYKYPLTQETIIFSDTGFSVGVGYFLEKSITQLNGLGTVIPTFKIDVACTNEDFYTASVNCEKLATDVQFSIESSGGLNGWGRVISDSITPTEPLPLNQFWRVMQTYNFRIHTTNIYKGWG